jgi:SNF2 family DNA or RNA helicase
MVDTNYKQTSGKFEELKDMISSLRDTEHKILIFSSFVRQLMIIKEWLTNERLNFCYLDGSTTNRQKIIDDFEKKTDIKLFLLSLKAGGTGLNLTAADYVFILDPWWNPASENQAIDRAHRIGQQKNVFVYKFITRKTVEEKILFLQEKKLKIANNIIMSDENFLKNLTQEDIQVLFE